MDTKKVTECVGQYVIQLLDADGTQACEQWLRQPDLLWTRYSGALQSHLQMADVDVASLSLLARNEPFLHLESLFQCHGLPETPTDWYPVPTTRATQLACLSIVLLSGLFGMEPVSYGSENDGTLFVNLVTLQGDGAMAEKSKGPMKGHTDAASFPLRGCQDPENSRIAPSPDMVFLAAMRNPVPVPTFVMPLESIIDQLTPEHVGILKGPNIVLNAQRSFQRGTKQILGIEHLVDGGPVLMDSPEGLWIRYTHSQSHLYDEDDILAAAAKAAFEAACTACVQAITLRPGDLLVVNNRKALHGRAPVGTAIGKDTRWLIRSYGLDCTDLEEGRRYVSPRYKLFP